MIGTGAAAAVGRTVASKRPGTARTRKAFCYCHERRPLPLQPLVTEPVWNNPERLSTGRISRQARSRPGAPDSGGLWQFCRDVTGTRPRGRRDNRSTSGPAHSPARCLVPSRSAAELYVVLRVHRAVGVDVRPVEVRAGSLAARLRAEQLVVWAFVALVPSGCR